MANRVKVDEQEKMDSEDAALKVQALRSAMKEDESAALCAVPAKSAAKYRELELEAIKRRFFRLLRWPGADPKEVEGLAKEFQEAKEVYADALAESKLAKARAEMTSAAFDAGVERMAYQAARMQAHAASGNGKEG